MNTQSIHTEVEYKHLNKWKFYTLMPVGSFITRTMVYPSSLVKTRVQGSTYYKGTFHAFRSIWQEEGFLAFYKGYGVNLIGLFIGPVYITALELVKMKLTERYLDSADGMRRPLSQRQLITNAVPLIAGASASLVSQTIMVPVDVISQRRMMQRKGVDKPVQTLGIVSNIFKNEGLRGFYRGYGVSLMTYAPSSAIVWASFEVYRRGLRALAAEAASPQHAWIPSHWLPTTWLSAVLCAIAGAGAGTTSGVLTNPLDVVRTRLQVTERRETLANTLRKIHQEFGMAGFARGATARVLSMAPTSAILMSAYELLKRASINDVTITPPANVPILLPPQSSPLTNNSKPTS